MTRTERNKAKRTKRLRGTTINKLCAIVGVISGLLSVIILDDGTALVFGLLFAIPSFFSRKGYYNYR